MSTHTERERQSSATGFSAAWKKEAEQPESKDGTVWTGHDSGGNAAFSFHHVRPDESVRAVYGAAKTSSDAGFLTTPSLIYLFF